MSQLAKSSGVSELWIGLDGRSFWAQQNTSMADKTWIGSDGEEKTEIKWKDSQPIDDLTKQCVYIDTNSQ